MHLIAECRVLLTSYDDFILGLRMNQALYESQEQQYRLKVAQLQARYEEKIKQLSLIAEGKELLAEFNDKFKFLEQQDIVESKLIEKDYMQLI